jgi:hypothetical protein
LAQKLVADGFKVMQRRHEIWTIERNARIMLVFKLCPFDCSVGLRNVSSTLSIINSALYICANFNSINSNDELALPLLLSTRSFALSEQAEVFQVIYVNAQSIRGFSFHVALRIGGTNNRVAVVSLSEK